MTLDISRDFNDIKKSIEKDLKQTEKQLKTITANFSKDLVKNQFTSARLTVKEIELGYSPKQIMTLETLMEELEEHISELRLIAKRVDDFANNYKQK